MHNVLDLVDYNTYITSFRQHLKHLFREEYDFNALSLQRDLPADFLVKIMDKKPLAVAIPKLHGGRGVQVKECLGVLLLLPTNPWLYP